MRLGGIILEAAETKSKRPDERPVPEILTSHIDRWLKHWRILFRNPDDAFWPSIKCGPLAYTYVGHIITETTRRELGVAVNPHLFRDCAVYTVARSWRPNGDRLGTSSAHRLPHHREALQQGGFAGCGAAIPTDP